jgi:hypothetical protein
MVNKDKILMINAKTMSKTLIAGLPGISGFIYCDASCSICFNPVTLEYTKDQERGYDATDCCKSLVCEKCASEEKRKKKKCVICLGMCTCIWISKNSTSLGGKSWKECHEIYTTFGMMNQRMRLLHPFIHRNYGHDWQQVVLIQKDGDKSQKEFLLSKYLQFEKDFFRWQSLFYIFRTLHYLPFNPTPQMLDFFDVEKSAPNFKIHRRFILKRFPTGFIVKLFHNFSLDENRTRFRRNFFLMILKRVLTERLR